MLRRGLRAGVRGLTAVHLTLDGCNRTFSLGDSLTLQQWRYYDHSSKNCPCPCVLPERPPSTGRLSTHRSLRAEAAPVPRHLIRSSLQRGESGRK